MKRRCVIAFLLIASLAAGAQTLPDAPSKSYGFVASGVIYNARERDTGYWFELGLQRSRLSGSMGFSDMATDDWGYRELEAIGRFWFTPSFAAEGGFGWGFGCFAPRSVRPCERWSVRMNAPLAGLAYRQPIHKHVSFLARMDLTRTQLSSRPPETSGGKDDGLRLRVGVLLTP